MSRVPQECHFKNQLASDWMHRGMDLMTENSQAALGQAVRCFDEAIALRRTLPLEDEPFFRYGLSAGWINRGDAMTRLGDAPALAGAVESYDVALELLESLSLEENALYPRRLAITWINRGVALQKLEASDGEWEAAECFREALTVLEHPSAMAVSDRAALQIGAWANLAGILARPDEALSAARTALNLAKTAQQTDVLVAEAALKAHHVLCRIVVKRMAENRAIQGNLVTEATEAVDEAMLLAAHWKQQDCTVLENSARDIFRLGCRIHERSEPRLLVEFLLRNLDPEHPIFPLDSEVVAAAQRAIWNALESLQADGFRFVASQDFKSFLEDVRRLREVEQRLQSLLVVA